MKRAAMVIAILLAGAGLVWLQTPTPAVDLATYMPSGALLYLRAADFGHLLAEWNSSQVKRDWLASDNYSVFAESNLFGKLGGVYGEYSATMGFAPGLAGIGEIAGDESALALYDIRELQFVYISHVGEAQLQKAQLWGARSRFEQRDVGGIPFWLRTDAGRTVAFSFVRGWLVVATRDDLIARALQLLAGGRDPSVASEGWYKDATGSTKSAGELRLVMDLDALAQSTYFRSYWVQRDVSFVRQYRAGIADLNRTSADITESRVFLRSAENPGSGPRAEDRGAAARLSAMAPADAGLYRVWAAPGASMASGLIVDKLIAPPVEAPAFQRYAPASIDLSQTAGTEADLETRIDEPPLPSEATLGESVSALRAAIEKTGVRAMMQIQETAPAGRTFIRMPCAVVLAASSPWDQAALEAALTHAIEPLWTSGGLGAGWQPARAGNSSIRAVDGLGRLYLVTRGDVLYLANDAGMLASVLDRTGAASEPATMTYAALFRVARERQNYDRLMKALDFASPINETGYGLAASSTATPAFFSQDLGSLARVLSPVTEIRVTEEDEGARVRQTVDYRWRR